MEVEATKQKLEHSIKLTQLALRHARDLRQQLSPCDASWQERTEAFVRTMERRLSKYESALRNLHAKK